MPKTLPAGSVKVPGIGRAFVANVRPDPFDERDLEYRPRLEPLPAALDRRSNADVLTQVGSSCTGHALATVVNTILGHQDPSRSVRVSPYMLYRAARRYDEFPGEQDAGSSLRGALKGWFNHGVALEETWPALDMDAEPDLDDETITRPWRERPLGAFYRVNPYRLDDVQSAIAELNVIIASAAIHDGWSQPVLHRRGTRSMAVIERTPESASLGGHAFAIAGYNELGLLIQNSWGPRWGKRGFATLPYEDWLDSAYDAWVARPGVPHTPFSSGRRRVVTVTGGDVGTGPGPDLRRLDRHVVNLGNDGRLSDAGRFVSTPAQLDRVVTHMGSYHDWWIGQGQGDRRDVVLYAHGGLNSEASGLETAEKHLDWWLNNHVYPITFAWQTGGKETILDQLSDVLGGRLPAGGLGFDLVEQFDRLVEGIARRAVRWAWDEIKENAEAAAKDPKKSDLPTPPGGSLLLERLAAQVATNPDLRIHLVGHSAGSLLTGALAVRMAEMKLPVASLIWLAPAYRVDRFESDLLPLVATGGPIDQFAVFALSERREQDDELTAKGITFYRKSLLYLVARGLEQPGKDGDRDVPLTGLERAWQRRDRQGRSWQDQVAARTGIDAGRLLVTAPSLSPADSRSDAERHGDLDDDPATMTSVLLRMLGRDQASDRATYRPRAGLDPAVSPPTPMPVPADVVPVQLPPDVVLPDVMLPPAEAVPDAMPPGAAPPPLLAAALMPFATTVSGSDASAGGGATIAVVVPSAPAPEVGAAPVSGSAVSDILRSEGWTSGPEKPKSA